MNVKSLGALVAVTAVLVVAALFVEESRKPMEQTAVERQPLFPKLMSKLKEVAEIRITTKDGAITLEERSGRWLVQEMHGYEADRDKVRNLMMGTAGLVLMEEKTSNPELYPKLGVEDVASAGANSAELSLSNRAGALLARLIVGNSRPSRSDLGMAFYVRKPGEAQSWLVRGELRLEKSPAAWINKQIIDIPAKRVRQVAVTQKDGSQLHIFKEKPEDPAYQLAETPINAEIKAPHQLESIAGLLADLSLTNVAPSEGVTLNEEQALQAVFHSFDGLQVNVLITEQEDEQIAAFSVNAVDEAGDAVKKQAVELEERLKPWLFTIPRYKVDALNKSRDELVEVQASSVSE